RKQPDGPRLVWTPVKEIERLRAKSHRVGPVDLKPGGGNPLSEIKAELADVSLEATPAEGSEIVLDVRGVRLRYDSAKQDLHVGDHKTWLPLRDGKLKLRVLIDRTSLTAWGADGLVYVPFPALPKKDERSFAVSVAKGSAKAVQAELHELRPIWK
ncbi:MAG: hypothetical protein K2W96_13825, partial [Gemmataceae bacterium]|nr:hypothetical protein [Gemmataceae bacterium]